MKLPRRPTTNRSAAALVVALVASAAIGLGVDGFVPSALGSEPTERVPDEPKPKKPQVDASAVYFGDARHFKKPAEVDADRVYAEIEEYKKIVADKLKPGDPKYEILMQKASKRFLCAVRKAARAKKHDLVARSGSVTGVENVPDITQSVIDRL